MILSGKGQRGRARNGLRCVSWPTPPKYSASGKPHVVLVPYPAQGHFSPVVFLGKKLAELGCAVTIANVVSIHEQIKVWDFPSELDIRLEPLHPAVDLSKGVLAAAEADLMRFSRAVYDLGGEFKNLIQALNGSGPRVTVIISDHYAGSWCAPVASEFGIPYAVYWPGSAAWFAVEYHVPLLISEGDLPIKDGEDREITYIPGIDSIKQSDLPWHYTEAVLEYFRAGAERLKASSWILCNTFHELEPEVVDAMKKLFNDKFLPIGPLFPVLDDHGDLKSVLSFLKEDRECLDWLDTQEPDSVLYVAFGSIAKLSQEEFEELALGLEASKVPFLLTVRPPQFVDEADTTVLVKNSDFYKNFVERTKGRGLVVSWAPQREVLAHRAVAGFVSHCGWNSVLESVSSGVPIICWPRIYEQGLNRKIMAESCRIGVEVWDVRSSDAFVKREEIAEAIARIFSDKARKARAREFRDAARKAAAPGGGSRNNLMLFTDLCSSDTRS
ncbi:anthocyanidin 3-O-glucosyltransferase 7 [Selaginella moellendorffii]|uniref:anthocyanidin 3-O-glucosyltransferase 7 n=1 Tax=Selaginella moellendorffii TaxID=88036 RepID=UPI000D1C38CC|nr:anthocyanidin 3-O-glucosyltransferase 7 [Selaginella moellendorffii]|eukprot:XP_002979810.2 anthocyanidin 3-O-glucosyltransferase 7 [Selaginella moellendorffii]